DTGRADSCSNGVSDNDEYGHTSAIRVVDRHRCMLQTASTVSKHTKRLSFDFRVPVSHSNRGFLMTASDELRLLVAAIVDDGLVQRAEAGPWVGADILNVERSEYIHHEVGSAVVRRQNVYFL